MRREELLRRLKKAGPFDLLVIGGGATGCGIALDAANRGLKVALAERGDFAVGASGRSTKLLHGGVRYLEAALLRFDRVQFQLVRDALYERSVLMTLAPHLTNRIPLVIPLYRRRDIPYIFTGLTIYDGLAAGRSLGRSQVLSAQDLLSRFPMIKGEGLKGGVLYYDGQFNDARMNLTLALTALEEGALAANYLEAVSLVKEGGRVAGAQLLDRLSGESFSVSARCVVNAAGPCSDLVRRLDDPAAAPLLAVSTGVHIVLDGRFAPEGAGITIPRTEDGRILFILPWQGHCLVGTTDDPAESSDRPVAREKEIHYLLRHLRAYFNVAVERGDVKAAWSGLRPLVHDQRRVETARLSRDHLVTTSPSGLLTVAGGKWTTYRKMAQDTVDQVVKLLGATGVRRCGTATLPLVGAAGYQPESEAVLAVEFGLTPEGARHLLRSYGSRAAVVARLCEGEKGEPLAPGHPYLKGEVLYAVRFELAQRPVDVLARRLPLGLLDRDGALAALPFVVETMARELEWDKERARQEDARARERLEGAL